MISKKFAVVKRWKNNPKDFQVIEYFATKREAEDYISHLSQYDRVGLEVTERIYQKESI